MRGLERGQDPLLAPETLKRVEGRGVVYPGVLSAAGLAQPGVLGAYRCVVQAGRDGVGQLDVAVTVLQHVAAGALQHTGGPSGEARSVLPRFDAAPAGLDAHETNAPIRNEGIEDPHGVTAPANAGDHDGRQRSELIQALRARFATDHRLELPDHQRVWMRA